MRPEQCENDLRYSTAALSQPAWPVYVNASHAVDSYIDLVEAGPSAGIDPAEPVVDGGRAMGRDHEVRLKAYLLRRCFDAAKDYPDVGKKRWKAWVKCRFYGADYNSLNVHRRTVERWCKCVDEAVDSELARRGLLASDRQLERGRRRVQQ